MQRTLAFAAVTTAAVIALAGCSQSGSSSMDDMDHGSHEPSASADASFGDADIMFATMMIPHHQQAVEMGEMLLEKDDVDPDVADLAQRIIDAQGPEIATMRGWLDDWSVDASAHEGMDHGDGMLSDEDMTALEEADGSEASRLFLEQMIVHHEGAIAMAQTEVDDGASPDAIALAETMVDAQTAEIAEMQQLLGDL